MSTTLSCYRKAAIEGTASICKALAKLLGCGSDLTQRIGPVKLNESIDVLIPDNAMDLILIDYNGLRTQPHGLSSANQIHDKAPGRRAGA